MNTMRTTVETITRLPIYLTFASTYREQLVDKKICTEAIGLFTKFVYRDVDAMVYNSPISTKMQIIHSSYLQESRDHLETFPQTLLKFYERSIQVKCIDLSVWKKIFCEKSFYLKKTCMHGVKLVDPNNTYERHQAHKKASATGGIFSEEEEEEVEKAHKSVRKRTAPKSVKP